MVYRTILGVSPILLVSLLAAPLTSLTLSHSKSLRAFEVKRLHRLHSEGWKSGYDGETNETCNEGERCTNVEQLTLVSMAKNGPHTDEMVGVFDGHLHGVKSASFCTVAKIFQSLSRYSLE